MLGIFAWPKAEAVVMLGGQDRGGKARFLDCSDPLTAIKLGRGKEGRIILLNCIPAFILAVLAIIFALVLY